MSAYFKRLAKDWALFRSVALVLLGSLVIIGLVIGFQYWSYSQSRLRLDETTNQLAGVQAQSDQIQAELSLLEGNFPDYQWLVSHHALDQQQRLDWVEELTRQRKSKNLQIEYVIEPQRPFEWVAASPDGTETYSISMSRMKLQVEALHEGWWLTLLNELERNANGLFVVRSCKAELNETPVPDGERPLSVVANCDLDWYSITKPNPEAVPAEVVQ